MKKRAAPWLGLELGPIDNVTRKLHLLVVYLLQLVQLWVVNDGNDLVKGDAAVPGRVHCPHDVFLLIPLLSPSQAVRQLPLLPLHDMYDCSLQGRGGTSQDSGRRAFTSKSIVLEGRPSTSASVSGVDSSGAPGAA